MSQASELGPDTCDHCHFSVMNCDWILLLGTAIEFVDQRSLYLLHFDHISYYAKQLMPVFIKKYKTKENLVYMNVKWIREGVKKKFGIFQSLVGGWV